MGGVLITGFEPFTTGQGLKLTDNPTGRWAEEVAARVPDCRSATLPVSYQETKSRLRMLFERYEPVIWLGLGFAPHRLSVDVECVALNIEHCETADNDGMSPKRREVIADGPLALTTRLNVDQMVADLSAFGLNARCAFHAGTFLCNQSYYLGCYYADVLGIVQKAGFIHVPPNVDDVDLVDALTSILNREVSDFEPS